MSVELMAQKAKKAAIVLSGLDAGKKIGLWI